MFFPRRTTLAVAASAALLSLVAACGGGSASDGGDGTVTIGALSNGAAKESTIQVPAVDAIRNELPQQIRDAGVLNVGLGLLPAGSPPLGFTGTDDKTLTGVEPDLARAIGGVLGLKVKLTDATWENMFVGIDSGRTDVGISNITDTEERKKKYDFATYREDNLALETLASNPLTFTGDPQALAGKRVYVGAGTNQEKILLQWQLAAAGPGQGHRRRVLPRQQRRRARTGLREDRRRVRAEPRGRLQRHPEREHPDPQAHRRDVLRGRGVPAGPDRRHHQEGQRPGQTRRRRDQPPHPDRPVPAGARGLEPLQRGGEELGDQPARPADHQLVTGRHVLDNPVRASLLGPHASFAVRVGSVLRYPPDVAPFVAVPDVPDAATWDDLSALLGPGALASISGDGVVPPPGWEVVTDGEGVQLVDDGVDAEPDPDALVLGPADVPEILGLVGRTRPGPFLARTVELGTYLGLRVDGELVAMAGERLHPPGWAEISAVCTDQRFRGHGLASRLVRAVAAGIRLRGEMPLLHAAATNVTAISLYETLGFRLRRRTRFTALRVPEPLPPELAGRSRWP